MYRILLSKAAEKDFVLLKAAHLTNNLKKLFAVLRKNPYQTPPPFKKLVGDLSGFYSRRLNNKHRLVYKVDEASKTVEVFRMWSHYE